MELIWSYVCVSLDNHADRKAAAGAVAAAAVAATAATADTTGISSGLRVRLRLCIYVLTKGYVIIKHTNENQKVSLASWHAGKVTSVTDESCIQLNCLK